jgi:putative transposase
MWHIIVVIRFGFRARFGFRTQALRPYGSDCNFFDSNQWLLMKYNPDHHHRRSIRLPEYDYSQSGIYFVTICTYQKQCLFGDIENGKMFLNQIGKIVREEWLKSAQIRREIELDEWVIMPNHLHGIVMIVENDVVNIGDENNKNNNKDADLIKGASLAPLQGNIFWQRKPRSLSSFVGGFKSAVTRRIKGFCTQSSPLIWQRNYYESIVRDEEKLNQIREYISDNPQKWAEDPEKPQNDAQELLIDFIF